MPEKVYKSRQVVRSRSRFPIATPITHDPQEEEENKDLDHFQEQQKIFESQINNLKQEQKIIETNIRKAKFSAEQERKKIVELAEINAFNHVKSAGEERERALKLAAEEKEAILNRAKEEAQNIIEKAESDKKEIEKKAYEEGYEKGCNDAFEKYEVEVQKLMERLKDVLREVIHKRNDIIESSEQQLSDIAVEVARKVVKSITENDKSVILRNVSESLRKIKGRTRVVIRVNVGDLELLSHHRDDFFQSLDDIEHLNILEDPNVEKGGCVIETDFGEINARISSQFTEVESAIKSVQPIKSV